MPENKLRVILQADTSKFTNSLNKANKQMVNFGKSMTKVGKSLSIGLSIPLAAAGVKALSSAAKFEKLQTQLNVLTGSADKGAESFKKLVEFSAGTPFQLDQLVEANNTLMGFGVSAEDAFKHLQSIGDIAAVSGGDLKNISVAFGQVAASGRLMGQDLLQLINNGVPIIDMLSASMGVAKSEIKEMVSQGAVTFPVLVKAFEDSTRQGGKFAGGMQQLSGTLGGVFSTLKDNVNIAFAEIGKSIVESTDLVEVSKKLIARIQELTEKFKALNPATKKTLAILAGIAAAIGPVLILIGKLSIGFSAVAKVLPIAAAGFRLLTAAMVANPILAVATAIAAVTTAIIAYRKSQKEANAEALKQMNVAQLTDHITGLEEKRAKQLEKYHGRRNSYVKATEKEIDLAKEQLKLLQQAKEEQPTAPAIPTTAAVPAMGVSETRKPITALGGITTAGVEATSDPVGQLAQSVAGSNELLKERLSQTEAVLNESQLRMIGLAQQFNEQVAPIIEGGLEQMATGIGEALGQAMASGGNAVQGLAQVLLSGIGNMATQLGQLAIGTGIAIEGIKKALQSLNPVVAVAAGIALVALGSLVKAKAAAIGKGGKGGGGDVPAFANGGIVSGPTLGLMGEYTGAKSNPEVIAPLNKLQNIIGDRQPQQVNVGGEFSLRGQDLIVALQRAEKFRGRIK
jgi:tape measure domain-containing protein